MRFGCVPNLTPSCMRLLFYNLLLFCTLSGYSQKSWHFGGAYAFGGAWNLHKTNDHPGRPSDVSSLGLLARLENEGNNLGFQAGLYMRWNDVRNQLQDNYYLDNGFRSVELRLQLVVPMNSRSSIAFGIAPRMVVRNNFSIVYASSSNGSHLESELEVPNSNADLNELNSSLILTYQYQLHKRWHFFLNADCDIQPVYAEDVVFENYDLSQNNEPTVSINSFLATLSGSIVFWIR